MKPVLYIFSGLPGTGKTTIAKEIANYFNAAYFRLDTIEHGLRELCSIDVTSEGYRLTYRLVADNLKVGNDVIVDCCNPWNLTRTEWEKVAIDNNGSYVNIEIICSDINEHKKRIETRENDIAGFKLPTWDDTQKRDYHAWEEARVIIDTGKSDIAGCVAELLNKLENYKR